MTTKEQKSVDTVNAIRQVASPEFRSVVPQATLANITDVGNPILNYQPMANEYLSILFNRIAFTWIQNKIYRNPLAILKKGNYALGTDIQEIFTNPAMAQEFNNNDMSGILTRTNPDVKVAYHRRNRKNQYAVSIDDMMLQGAFESWGAHSEFVASITNSMYSGNYIDEFTLTKQVFSSAVDNAKIVVTPSLAPDIKAQGGARLLTGQIKDIVSGFGFPSPAFNNYANYPGATGSPITTFTNPEDVIVLIRADVMNVIDLDVLSVAFNMDKAEFMGNIVKVDSFPNKNIQAIIMDKNLPQIYDNIFKMTEFWNSKTLTWNYWLTVFQTFSLSPFVNGVALVANAPTPTITSVAISPKTATKPKNSTQLFTPTVVSVGGANKGVLWSLTGNASTAITSTINASGLLTIPLNETATTLTIKATSVFDPTKSDTATVTVS